MLNIFYGRESIDKEKIIFERIKQAGRALIIVPDQFTLEAEKQAFSHLGVQGLMDIEVVSMSRLGSRLISELGGGKQTFIDKYGRHMILSRIAREERENLRVFRGLEERSSFIELLNNFISEMKQYNCGPADMAAMAAEGEEGTYTRMKLEDISLLYSRYSEEIQGKYTDSEDYIDLFLSKISQSNLIAGNHIWVYGFDSFAPKAVKVLGQLMAYSEDTNVVLTYDRGCRDEEVFGLTEIVMANLECEAEAVGADHKRQQISEEYAITSKERAVSHIERELYSMPAAKFAGSPDGITLVEAAGLYNEAESAAVYVLSLVRDKGLKYRDIKIVCNDQEIRGPIIERVFKEYGIDVFSDAKRDIMSSPVVEHILSLIDVVTEKYRSEDVFRSLKSGLGDLSSEEIWELENYAVKYKIRGSMWKKTFVKGQREYGAEGLEQLNRIREKAAAPLKALEPIFKAESTADFIYGFYKYLYEIIKLPEKTLEFIKAQEESGRLDLAEETSQIWGQTVGILDQIMEIMGREPFRPKEFAELFKVGLSQVEIGVLPPTKDGLLMGTMQRTRTGAVKALVVLGANEGVLPQESPVGGLFSREEKEIFKDNGREICKVDSIQLMEEKLAIYRNLSEAEEYLWVSCSLSDTEGKEIKPSSVFLKLREIFPEKEIKKDVLNENNPLPLINSQVAGMRHLTEEIREFSAAGAMSSQWKETLEWCKANRPEALESIKEGIGFTNQIEKLGRQAAEALYKKDTGAALSLSPSRIERFSRCPFSHLVAYGLRPDERRVYEVAPREIGDIYHQCLMSLSQVLTKEDLQVTHPLSPWMTITKEQCAKLVDDIVAAQTETYNEGLFKEGSREKYRSDRITEICREACWAAAMQVRAGHIEKNSFETSFARGRAIKPIEVDIGGETAYIEGKIDRVDYLPGDRVKIIDYKTGNESFSIEEARAGYRLQLMVYLQAACETVRKPAGVFYFKITEPMKEFDEIEPDKEALEKETRKNFKLNGIIVNEPQVIESIAGDFSGFSEIVPLRAGKERITGTGRDSLITEEEFADLQNAVAVRVEELCRELADGTADIHPMKTKDRSACTYCQYKGICRFDTAFEGCKFNVI